MLNYGLKYIRAERWFYAFLCIHLLAWTITPALIRYTLPMDSIEGAIWGHQFEWGYDKNPFMNAWLTGLAMKLGGYHDGMIYLFSQLSVVICFWAIWQLGKKMLSPIYALIAVLLLETIQYYNFHAIDFNDNTLELSLWALTTLFFYQALTTTKWRDWLFTGVFAALSMMTKYYTIMLLFPMLALMITQKEGRAAFYRPAFYAALLLFFLIMLPHIVWLFSHDFITLNYALYRVNSPPHFLSHINFPLEFAWQQFEALAPCLLFIFFLFIGKKPFLSEEPHALKRFDKAFLLYMGIGPLLLTILLSAFSGIRLRAGWGQPLFSLWGIMLLAWLLPNITPQRFYRFMTIYFIAFAAAIIIYASSLVAGDAPSSANYPGKLIADHLLARWQQQFHTPLRFVGGSRWLGGNIAFYTQSHPTVYIDWDKQISPWIDEAALKKSGAIFVWDPRESKQTPYSIVSKRFKALHKPFILRFNWLRNDRLEPIEIIVAFLPPENAR